AMHTNTDSSHSRNTDPDKTLGSCLNPDVTIATDHPDQYGPSDSKVLRYQYGLKWLSRLWASTQPLVVKGAIDFNSDPDCCRATDLDMAVDRARHTMAPGDSVGHLDRHGPSSNMALRYPHNERLQTGPLASIWPFVVPCAMDINCASSGGIMDPDMVLLSSLGLDIRSAWPPHQSGPQTSTLTQLVVQTPGIEDENLWIASRLIWFDQSRPPDSSQTAPVKIGPSS
ncbi:hypothetical protein STEG23_006679, partial [Scotinomys teguina]